MKTRLGCGKGSFSRGVCLGPHSHSAVQYVWPNVRGPTSGCVSNAQLKHACEIKYFGSVKVQTAKGLKLCRLTRTVRQVQTDSNICCRCLALRGKQWLSLLDNRVLVNNWLT